MLERLPEDGRALIVGHNPTNEAAILGLTGEVVPPLKKAAGALVVAEREEFRIKTLHRDFSS